MRKDEKAWNKIVQLSDKIDGYFGIYMNYSLRFFNEKELKESYDSFAFFSRGRKKELVLHPYVLNMMMEGKEELVESILFHEYVHFFNYLKIKELDINTDFLSQKSNISLFNFVIKIGYRFWTEFEAYAKTSKRFGNEVETILTKDMMIRNFNEIKSFSNSISSEEEFDNLLTKVEDFVYDLAKYIGESLFVEEKNNDIDKDFNNLIDKLHKLCVKMYKNTYSKYLPKRLFNIGECLLNEIYVPCNVYICRSEKRWVYFYDKGEKR